LSQYLMTKMTTVPTETGHCEVPGAHLWLQSGNALDQHERRRISTIMTSRTANFPSLLQNHPLRRRKKRVRMRRSLTTLDTNSPRRRRMLASLAKILFQNRSVRDAPTVSARNTYAAASRSLPTTPSLSANTARHISAMFATNSRTTPRRERPWSNAQSVLRDTIQVAISNRVEPQKYVSLVFCFACGCNDRFACFPNECDP
jgi:hypothetical protein